MDKANDKEDTSGMLIDIYTYNVRGLRDLKENMYLHILKIK
jgi:hypothetical protein